MAGSSYSIIGGGIVGASIAYHLSKEIDAPITVYEKSTIASETTAKSGATFGWYGDQTQIEMKKYAWELYNEFMEDPVDEPCYVHTGSLKVATSEEQSNSIREILEPGYTGEVPKLMTAPESASMDFYTDTEIKKNIFVPDLATEEIEGAVYRPHFGYMDPVSLTKEFVKRAERQGVEFQTKQEVTNIKTDQGSVTEITVNEKQIPVDELICAAGPWNIKMAEMVGLDLPVEHTLGPVVNLKLKKPLPYTMPLLSHEETGTFCRQNRDGSFLVGHRPRDENAPDRFNPDEVGDKIPEELRQQALEEISRLLPCLEDAEQTTEWIGVRSTITDDRPIVGWTDIDGFSIAAFDSSGIQLAPAVGRMITQQLVHNDPTKHYSDLSITRFNGYSDLHNN
jgi:sarcosine oxidase, subunit beta